jgi:GntR family transcriptional regulator
MKNSINRHGQTPIYEQIYQNLKTKIDDSEFSAGAAFPSERELAEKFGVSRMTVRQALNTLKKEGLIYHERGIGAFVSKRKLDVHTRNLVGFTEEMIGRGLKPSSELLLAKIEKADEETAADLGIEIGEDVFHLQRLRLADDSPMAFEDAYLPAVRYPNLEKLDLGRISLYEVLEKDYGVKMSHSEEFLEALAVSKEIAKSLSIKTGSPVLMVHRVVFSDANLAVESVRTYYRADRYRATFHLTKNGL